MGQFVDYVSSFWPLATNGKTNELPTKDSNKNSLISPLKNHVTFADSSFSFGRHEGEKAAKLAAVSTSNQRTITLYQTIGLLAFLLHLSLVIYPQYTTEEFEFTNLQNYQHLSLSCFVPFIVYWSAIGAMVQVNKPLSEGAKLSSKNPGLDLDNNPFITSTKIIIALTAFCQIGSILMQELNGLLLIIIPFWCYKLTSKIAQTEYERYSSSPRKSALFKSFKSPTSNKTKTPSKKDDASPVRSPKKTAPVAETTATPRTRTRRAVKNLITGVSDKYHAFEQSVAHQFSQKMFPPLSPKTKMIAEN